MHDTFIMANPADRAEQQSQNIPVAGEPVGSLGVSRKPGTVRLALNSRSTTPAQWYEDEAGRPAPVDQRTKPGTTVSSGASTGLSGTPILRTGEAQVVS